MFISNDLLTQIAMQDIVNIDNTKTIKTPSILYLT